MSDKEIGTENGVKIPAEAILKSKEKKLRRRTLRQTQVYRDVANLKFIIAKYMGDSPRKYAKYFDGMLTSVSNAKQSLALGLICGDAAQKGENMNFAQVLIEDLQDDAVILHQLDIISKAEKKEIKKLAQRISMQIVRLRDYFNGQGIDMNGNTLQK